MTEEMYASIRIPWSNVPSVAETLYRTAGYARTQGTMFILPPAVDMLRLAYNTPPRPKTKVSSGAVALCKHYERGGSSSEHGRAHPFWPLPRGSNSNKTEVAAEVLENVLDNVCWKNVIWLHHGVAVYEVRNGKGYGMRWTLKLHKDSADTENGCDPSSQAAEDADSVAWKQEDIVFRGFLEPIIGLDHELVDDKDDGTGA